MKGSKKTARLLSLLLTLSVLLSVITPMTVAATGTVVNVGHLTADAAHPSFEGEFLYMTSENGVSDTWQNYFATSDDCVKLRKSGSTEEIGIALLDSGMTSDSILLNRGEKTFCLRNSQWYMNCAGHSDVTPFAAGDVLIIEGEFTSASGNVTAYISKTYITMDASGKITFSTTDPASSPVVDPVKPEEPVKPEGLNVGHLTADSTHLTVTGDGYLYMKSESGVGDLWQNYFAANDDCVKLRKSGSTEEIGIAQLNSSLTSHGIIMNRGETTFCLRVGQAYLNYAGHSDLTPFAEGDVLIIEGNFTSASGTLIYIEKTYITMDASGVLTFSTTDPGASSVVDPDVPEGLNVGRLTADSSHLTVTDDGYLYMKSAAGVTDTWQNYFAANDDCVKLRKSGSTEEIGIALLDSALTGDGIILNRGETIFCLRIGQFYLNCAGHSDLTPFAEGDVLIIEGNFTSASGTLIYIEKTYITMDSEGALTFSATDPAGGSSSETGTVIDAGAMSSHANGNTLSGVYFTLAENEAPYNADWSLEYTPTASSCVQLVRGDVTTSVANPERGAIVKYGKSDYYLKCEAWALGDKMPLQPGDILIVEGTFTHAISNTGIRIAKTYISIGEDGIATFSTTEPTPVVVIEVGSMLSDERGQQDDGIYFLLSENAVPVDTSWGVRYHPVNADVVKRVHDGVTTSVGNVEAGTMLKFGDIFWYMPAWSFGGLLEPGDMLIIEGNFTNNDNGVTFHVSKSVITCENDGSLTYTTSIPTAIEGGTMSSHANGITADGFYFTLAANEVPVDDTWGVRYHPINANVIKLTRNNVTTAVGNTAAGTILKYGETDWYLAYWAIGGALQTGDILEIDGKFVNDDNGVTVRIQRTYVIAKADGSLLFTTELPSETTTIDAGSMLASPNGMTETGIYFEMGVNEAPYETGWSLLYAPEAATCIQLIRDDVTTSIAKAGIGTIVKYSPSQYYLKCEAWTMGELMPLQEGDILVVEGNFNNEADNVTIHISKTYILIKNGQPVFSTEYPTETVYDVIDAGSMQSHVNGKTDTGVYFTLNDNTAPYDDWNIEYAPLSQDAVKLIRGEETHNVGIVGRGTIVKFGATDYYLKCEAWTMGELMPLQEGDILVIEGQFLNGTTVLDISLSYILIENGQPIFSTEYPTETVYDVIDAGSMQSHASGKTDTGIYFTLNANSAPFENWDVLYAPMTDDAIKLIRDGETHNVAIPERGTIVKFSETDYYLKCEAWTMGELMPLQEGDILVIEGQFLNGTTILDISLSYILIENGTPVFSTEYPTETVYDIIDAGSMQSHASGKADTGIYFTLNDNTAPYDDWNTEYAPLSEDAIKLIRGEETHNLGIVGRGTIVKFGNTEYFLKCETWTMGELMPLQEGDILVIEGQFLNGTTILDISLSYILIENGKPLFSTEYPTETVYDIIDAGPMQSHASGKTDTGIYFTLNANSAPYDDWNTEYAPLSEDAIKLIRGEETHNLGIVGRGTIVKFRDTEYFLKCETWTMGELMPLQQGDILVIEGQFLNGTTILNISLSYISIGLGTVSIGTEYPDGDATQEIIELGHMKSNPTYPALLVDEANGACGLYFTMDDNTLPHDDTWSNRFASVTKDSIRLIRNGETISIGNTAAGEVLKYSANGYYLCLDKWAHSDVFPITQDDILLIDGYFTDGTTVVHISKTYISFRRGMALFTTEYPDGTDNFTVVNAGTMKGDSRGMTNSGVYFDMTSNAAPYDTHWRTEYYPVNESNIKLVRKGVTYNVGISGRGTIVKFSATEYYLKCETWTMGDLMPLQEGDVLIVEGEFINGATNTVLNISRSYIGIYYGMPFFSTSMPSGAALNRIKAGTMLNDVREMTATGVYFDMEKNSAPHDNWNVEYSPLNASNVKLIRDGVTYNVGIPKRGTIVKFSDTEYYLKCEVWTMGNLMPMQDGDIFIVSGEFINSKVGAMLEIDTTYVFIQDGDAFVAKSMGDLELKLGDTKQLEVPGTEETVWTLNNNRLSVDETGLLTALTNRGSTRVIAVNGLAGYFWTVSMYEETEFGKVSFTSSDEEMTIGVWAGSCHDFDNDRLDELQEAGINLIIGVNEAEMKGDMFTLLNRARNHGISIIIDLRDWDGESVPFYVGHPALKGFLMSDEPCATDFETLADLKEKFDEVMPEDKVFYVNLFPQACAYEDLFGVDFNPEKVDYEQYYVEFFVESVEPEQLSVSIYPLLHGEKNDDTEALVIRPTYFRNLEALATVSKEAGIPLEYTILSSQYDSADGTYVLPTDAELRWQMTVGLTYGATVLNHYAYASDEEGAITMFDLEKTETTDLYESIMSVNKELLSWIDIYLSYVWCGTAAIDVDDVNPMLAMLQTEDNYTTYGCLADVKTNQDLLIGSFENDKDTYAYMFTNAGNVTEITDVENIADFAMEDAEVTLTLKEGDYRCVAIICDGEISYLAVNDDFTVTFSIPAEDGVFVIPMFN